MLVALQLKHSRISADYHTWAFACSVCPLQMDTHLYLWGPPPTSCTALLHPRKKIPPASCSTFSRSLTAPCELRVSHLANGFSAASHTKLHQYHHMAEGQRRQVFLEAVEIRFQKKMWAGLHCEWKSIGFNTSAATWLSVHQCVWQQVHLHTIPCK